MNLKSLSNAEMLQISEEWITPKRDAHGALAKIAATAGLLPILAAAHTELQAIEGRSGDDAREAELKALIAQCVELDRRHDAYVRRIFGVCTALAEAAGSEEQAAAYLAAGNAVFPAGLSAAQATYKDEAGQALLVDERLTNDHRATLKAIKTPDGTLLEDVTRWKEIAKELGATETARTRVAATPSESKGTDAVAARNAWINTVSALTTVFTLATPDAKTRVLVLAPLEAETAKARRPAKAPAPEAPAEPTG